MWRMRKNTRIYLLTFLQRVQDAQDSVMTHARQRDGVSSQHVGHDLAAPRLVQLVRHSLLEHEHGSVLSTRQIHTSLNVVDGWSASVSTQQAAGSDKQFWTTRLWTE